MSKLIIFDCDGVLVDSEIIASQIESQMLIKLGYPISVEEHIKKFTGMNIPTYKKSIKALGVVCSDEEIDATQEAVKNALKTQLQPLMLTVLEDLIFNDLQKCVASNSEPDRVRQVLKTTHQDRFFDDKCIFTSSQVKQGKPAPDLFLFAAKQMGYDPKDCLVIEDSIVGIQAAKSAHMSVIAFLAASHTQFDWYRERIQKQEVPIVYSQEGVLSAIKNFIKK